MADITEKITNEYDASQIQVLEGLEAVRKRRHVYRFHLPTPVSTIWWYEIGGQRPSTRLGPASAKISPSHQGRAILSRSSTTAAAIPVDTQDQTGKSALEVVFTVLHAGGKFGGGGTKVSGGLTAWAPLWSTPCPSGSPYRSAKNGIFMRCAFPGARSPSISHVVGKTDRVGTTVTFKPDHGDFEIPFTIIPSPPADAGAGVSERGAAHLHCGRAPGHETSDEMCYEGVIREFVSFLNRSKTPLHDEVIYVTGVRARQPAEIALQYNDSYNEVYRVVRQQYPHPRRRNA
jgi:DNA gyrase subunit B